MEEMKRFVKVVKEIFETKYLRQPTQDDIERQFKINEVRGFLGMFASLDICTINGKFAQLFGKGNFKIKMVIDQSFEVIANQSFLIWHVFFGLLGSNNDMNVLDRSPFITNLLQRHAQDMDFVVMVIHVQSTTYLLMESILLMEHLCSNNS